jgi:hypothetical protein
METKLAKVNFNEGAGEEEPNKALTRTGIQFALAPMIAKVFSAMPGYDPLNNVKHARRTLRAMMTIAIQPLISMGAPKEFLKAQLLEALDHALTDHAANQKLLEADKKAEKVAAAWKAVPTFTGFASNVLPPKKK